MLYWLTVCLLVVIGVAAPFLLLYLLGLVVWLAVNAAGSLLKSVTHVLPVRKALPGAHWSGIWRKTA